MDVLTGAARVRPDDSALVTFSGVFVSVPSVWRGDVIPVLRLPDRGKRRYWIRRLLAPRSAWRWRKFALELFREHGVASPGGRMLSKPLHGYMRRGWGTAARCRVLIDNYRWLVGLFRPDCLRAICAGERLELARVSGRRNSSFRLYLAGSTTVNTPHEGELTIWLAREGGSLPLSRLTLSLITMDGRLALAIGGLQGPEPGHKREVIDATRDLNGLRPKDATLLAARTVAEALGGVRLHAVSDARHVRRALRNGVKVASYDAYWRERGAMAQGPFGWVFPPLGPLPNLPVGRERAKQTIAAGVRAFIAANQSRMS